MQISKDPVISSSKYIELLETYKNKSATITIIGLGYVGLPLALSLSKTNFNILGFDLDQNKIDSLKNGTSYIKGISNLELLELNKEKFLPTSNIDEIKESDAFIICVPTPLTKNREPDLSYVKDTSHALSKIIKKGQLVILESTTYPGTTNEVLKPILEESGLKVGKDIYLAYSPEREDPGNINFSTGTVPKVVGADDKLSLELANQLYKSIIEMVVLVQSSATAEAVKLTENIFRSTNIALVNELKVVYSKMGIDIWEVIKAAKTKPFGFMPFYPGPGLGGHCIPIDPFYLTWKAREYGVQTKFVELSGEINNSMPSYVINRLREELDNRFKKGINGSKILLLGMAYKSNVDDVRESPSLVIYSKLKELGAYLEYHDTFVPVIPDTREHNDLSGIKSISLEAKTLSSFDAVLICTAHDNVDYDLIGKHSKLVVDTRNAMEFVENKDNITNA